MFRPQPLHQLPKLPSHVVPACAACLEKQSGQTAPLLRFYAAGGSYLSPSRLPSIAPPRSFFSNIYWWPGAHGIVDSAPGLPSSHVVQRGSHNAKTLAHACFAKDNRKETMWFPCGSTRFQQ